MNNLQKHETKTLPVEEGQMLYSVPVDRNGVEEVVCMVDEPNDIASDIRAQQERIKLAGIWSHLDWQEAERRLAELDNDSIATPPVTDLP